MNQADREIAERHQAIRESFRSRPAVSAWKGQPLLPPEVTATLGFVIPVDDGAVRRRLEGAVRRLQATGAVAPFAPEYWHITIVPPALLTDGSPSPPRLLPASMIDEALTRGRSALRGQGPFDVLVRGLNAFRDVVVAVPYDCGRGPELRGVLRSALPELPELYPEGQEPLPHISLAQYAREDGLEGIVELVQRERETDFGRFRARRLEMFVLPWHNGVPGRVEKHQLPLDQP